MGERLVGGIGKPSRAKGYRAVGGEGEGGWREGLRGRWSGGLGRGSRREGVRVGEHCEDVVQSGQVVDEDLAGT